MKFLMIVAIAVLILVMVLEWQKVLLMTWMVELMKITLFGLRSDLMM